MQETRDINNELHSYRDATMAFMAIIASATPVYCQASKYYYCTKQRNKN